MITLRKPSEGDDLIDVEEEEIKLLLDVWMLLQQ